MIKTISTSILLFISIHVVTSQAVSTDLLFTYEIEEQLAQGEMRSPGASYAYTFIGDYVQAIAAFDIHVSWGVDSLDLTHLDVKPAIERIVDEARNQQIVIISESHLKPQHSIFAKELIISLTEHGFNHLGLEAFGSDSTREDQLSDTMLNVRGFVDFETTGYYTREPQMADLVRTAAQSGYKLFAYEREMKLPNKTRDEMHADNFIRYLKKHPSDKFVIVCGWHHAIESKLTSRGPQRMAYYLKEKYQVDPLTVYQDNFTERIIYNEHEILAELRIDKPSVFVENNNQIARLTNKVDIEVLHPKTKYISGRPGWLFQDESYKEYDLDRDLIDMELPLFLKAYKFGEQENGTPIDIIEIKQKYDQRKLILKPGKYILRIENKKESKDIEILVE